MEVELNQDPSWTKFTLLQIAILKAGAISSQIASCYFVLETNQDQEHFKQNRRFDHSMTIAMIKCGQPKNV